MTITYIVEMSKLIGNLSIENQKNTLELMLRKLWKKLRRELAFIKDFLVHEEVIDLMMELKIYPKNCV